jgi:LacI family transcriptional regulator, galactose operon repressor
MTKKASIADVAKLAGVSRTTVSYVLNNVTTIHISEKTRQRVLNAARELRYHPNASARSLARQRTLTLGLVINKSPAQLSADAFLPSVLYGIASVTAAAGFKLLVEAVEDVSRPDAYISLFHEAHVDGIILACSYAGNRQLAPLRDVNFPIVVWGQIPGSDLPFVDVDNVRAAQVAVEHLIALGHRRIACITNAPPQFTESIDRLRGYRNALEAAGIPFAEALTRYGNYDERSGFDAMCSLLGLSERPSAVFAASDVIALGALRAARSAGLQVPLDLAVVGFDDIQLAEFVLPPLTTVRVPAHAIGATAARMVLDNIQTSISPVATLLGTELVIRESSGGFV